MPEHPACTKTPNPLDEFGVISRFFTDRSFYPSAWPSQGAGDDCAFLDVGPMRLAVTADMMALGSHFLENASPYTVGRKALAVNLSDLAAAGSEPKAFFLSISLPRIDENWLEGFSRGLLEEARRFNCPLRGGDTVKSFAKPGQSPYTAISITAMGELPAGKGLTRAGARVGEDIWVSGTPGDAFAALGQIFGYWAFAEPLLGYFRSRMDLPEPRVALGRGLLNTATACCDISDGLIGDLKHILERSGVSARLFWPAFPESDAMKQLPEAVQQRCVLSGGDDYELLFTAPADRRDEILRIAERADTRVSRIGEVLSAGEPLQVIDEKGSDVNCAASFNHFGEVGS